MKNKLTVLAFLMFVITSVSFAQTTRNVPSSYATIQAAITAAVDGDIIQIAAGTYNNGASTLTVDKSLTFIGAGPSSNPTTIITSTASRIITLSATGKSFSFQDLIIEGNDANNGIYAGSAININSLSMQNVIARNCQVALYLSENWPGADPLTTTVNNLNLDNVTLTNNKFIGAYIGKTVLSGTVINSTFTDNGYSNESPDAWQKVGLQFVNFDDATVPYVQVTNSTFTNNGSGASNIERTGLSMYTAYNLKSANELLTVTGCSFSDHYWAVRLKNEYSVENTATVNGTFTNNLLDIWFNRVVGSTSSTLLVRRTFPGIRTVGTGPIYDYNTIQAAINAANSGDVIQVATGAYAEAVTINKSLTLIGTGNPTATSFTLTNGAVLGVTSGGITAPTTYVNQTTSAGSKIQDGILLASTSGAVNVAAGTYTETVTVNKSPLTITGTGTPTVTKFILIANPVTITGFNAATIIELNSGGSLSDALDAAPIGGTVNLSGGSFSNFTIDKPLTINGNGAIVNPGSPGIIISSSNVTITGFTFNDVFGSFYAIRILTGLSNIAIHSCDLLATLALEIQGTTTGVNAEDNYWGTVTLIQIQAKINDPSKVDFDPWFGKNLIPGIYAVGVSVLPNFTFTSSVTGNIEISTDASFSDIILSKSLTAVTSYNFSIADLTGTLSGKDQLANGTQYYWRTKNGSVIYPTPPLEKYYIFTTVNKVVPTLNAITPGATSAYISWYPLPYSSGLKYDLYISDDNGTSWASPINTDKTYYTLPLVQGKTYKVQVRSTNSNGSVIISYSARSAGFTAVGPPTPTPSYPTDPAEDGLVYANPPTLFWFIEGNEPTITYEIEVKPSAVSFDESNLVAVAAGKTFKKLGSSLTAGSTYHWRVRSVSGSSYSNWSTAATFEMYTRTATVAIIPTPSWPVNNATVYSNPPTLYWYLGEDKTGLFFNVKITRVSTNTTTTLTDWSQDLFKELPASLIPGESYTWNVRSSVNSDGASPSGWSSNGSFIIASTASGAATTPIPSWPVGGAIVDGTMAAITLNWTAYSNQPLDFMVKIATSSSVDGTGMLNHGSHAEGSWVSATTSAIANNIKTLTAGATYYWQVKSRLTGNISVESPWSMVANFSTAAGSSSVVPLVISPNYLQPINKTTAFLTWNIPVQSESHLKYDLQYSKNADFSSTVSKTNLNETAIQITGLESNATYYWRVLSKTDNGSISSYSTPGSFKTSGATAVEDQEVIPTQFELSQNYPNPFNPSTRITYSLPQNSFVSIKVYDMLGREVRSLVNTEMLSGNHSVEWSGIDNAGSKVSSGTYIYRITAGNFVAIKKMILVK
ncbi:MAG: T9SS type A sorting domain-containing protein [Ignavibacteriales bacterium]|nr:T9SS type A sorting domain-containing protein [Ignavibacteriales bacterium]